MHDPRHSARDFGTDDFFARRQRADHIDLAADVTNRGRFHPDGVRLATFGGGQAPFEHATELNNNNTARASAPS